MRLGTGDICYGWLDIVEFIYGWLDIVEVRHRLGQV